MKDIIVIQHRAAGNGEVGTMWHESKLFNEDSTLKEVCDHFGYKEDIIIPTQESRTP